MTDLIAHIGHACFMAGPCFIVIGVVMTFVGVGIGFFLGVFE